MYASNSLHSHSFRQGPPAASHHSLMSHDALIAASAVSARFPQPHSHHIPVDIDGALEEAFPTQGAMHAAMPGPLPQPQHPPYHMTLRSNKADLMFTAFLNNVGYQPNHSHDDLLHLFRTMVNGQAILDSFNPAPAHARQHFAPVTLFSLQALAPPFHDTRHFCFENTFQFHALFAALVHAVLPPDAVVKRRGDTFRIKWFEHGEKHRVYLRMELDRANVATSTRWTIATYSKNRWNPDRFEAHINTYTYS
jgi:hypothetical protein